MENHPHFKGIFADGFVPNSPEFRSTLQGTTFGVQRAEHLRTGTLRAYFAREGDGSNVRFYQRGAPVATCVWRTDGLHETWA